MLAPMTHVEVTANPGKYGHTDGKPCLTPTPGGPVTKDQGVHYIDGGFGGFNDSELTEL